MRFHNVIILPKVNDFLTKRNLNKQFGKAVDLILAGKLKTVSFKKRQPSSLDIYYFRINKQFRAICEINGNVLEVIKVDNHQ